LQVTSVSGCTATDTINVLATNRPNPSLICIVTVDSSSQFNQIIWEKDAIPDAIDSFIVFREVTTNNYLQIGAVSRSALSVFTDNNVNVNSTNYRYKIAWRDTCGNTDALSPYHSTIHLQYLGLGNLQWTSYDVENNPTGIVAGYEIFRDDASTGNFQLLQTVSGTSRTFTDINYSSYPNARYVVDIITTSSLNCSPTRSFSTSRSNIRSLSGTAGINQPATGNNFRIFPNPAEESIAIEFNSPNTVYPVSIEISDAVGRVVKKVQLDKNGSIVVIGDLSPGIYTIQAESVQYGLSALSTFIKK
ncbi:MAG: T9SS type A sorting domain-containing protein, partial [Bacteroidota bacterium]